jgi:hypothetical protein
MSRPKQFRLPSTPVSACPPLLIAKKSNTTKITYDGMKLHVSPANTTQKEFQEKPNPQTSNPKPPATRDDYKSFEVDLRNFQFKMKPTETQNLRKQTT